MDAMHLDLELLCQPRGIGGMVAMGMGQKHMRGPRHGCRFGLRRKHRVAGDPGIDQEHRPFDFDAEAGMAKPGDLHGSPPIAVAARSNRAARARQVVLCRRSDDRRKSVLKTGPMRGCDASCAAERSSRRPALLAARAASIAHGRSVEVLMSALGYLVPEFPSQTHAFFWREVQAMRAEGVRVVLMSTRRPPPSACPHDFGPAALAETLYAFPPPAAALGFSRHAPGAWPARCATPPGWPKADPGTGR